MANTYTLIASNTLSSSAASVTFSSIPNTYTDLVLRVSARTSRADAADSLYLELNSDSTDSNYSYTRLFASFASNATGSSRAANRRIGNTTGNNATSNTFSSGEIYIPSYTVSQNKQIGANNFGEDNGNNNGLDAVAFLWRNTNAITSVKLLPVIGPDFVSGSSFFLYGIKSS